MEIPHSTYSLEPRIVGGYEVRMRGEHARMIGLNVLQAVNAANAISEAYKEHEHPPEIDTVRQAKFWKQLGLPPTPVLYLRDRHFDGYAREQAQIGRSVDTEVNGSHDPVHNISFVHATGREMKHHPELIESIGVHEQAHATGYRNVVYDQLGMLSSVVGFDKQRRDKNGKYSNRGPFLEEGFAELMRGVYVDRVLGRPNGFDPQAKPLGILPSKYSHPEKTISYGLFSSYSYSPENPLDYAAWSLELLIMKEPELARQLVEARLDPAKEKDIYETARRVSPEVLTVLRQPAIVGGRLYGGFGEGARIVAEATFGSLEAAQKQYDQNAVNRAFGLEYYQAA